MEEESALMNYCKYCGKEVNLYAEICPHCGRRISDPPTNAEYQYSKKGIGVVMALFLGIIGLIIGICMYPSGTTARETFIKGWVTTFIITIVIGVLIAVIGSACIANLLGSYY